MRQTTIQIIEKIKQDKTSHEIMKTGLEKIDTLLDGGFYPKEIIVIGAHTGTGKSQLSGQIMLNIVRQGYKCAYFSLEISSEMILSRLVGMIANIKPTVVRFGDLTKDKYDSKLNAESQIIAMGDLINYYDDCYELETIASEVKANNYEFVVIDFIQNLISKVADEYSRLSHAAVFLQKLAKETGCTILVLSQLSNTAAKDGGSSKLLEYKGSGSIAMVADLGFILERPTTDRGELYDPEAGTILTLKKNRRGVSGNFVKLGYELPGGLIYEK